MEEGHLSSVGVHEYVRGWEHQQGRGQRMKKVQAGNKNQW